MMHKLGIKGVLLAGVVMASLSVSTGLALAAASFSQAPGSPFLTAGLPTAVAYSPSGGFLASAALRSDTLSIYSVDPATGDLTSAPGSPYSVPDDPLGLAYSPSGRFIATADYNSSNIAEFAVDPSTGALTPVPGSPFGDAGSGPIGIAYSPSGGLLATANDAGTVSVYTVDPSSGALTEVPGSPFPSGSYTQSLAFSPSGNLLVAGNEGGSLSVFSVDQSTGALTPVSGSPFGSGGNPQGVAFSPSGDFVAATNQQGSVAVLSVNESTGALTQVQGSPFSTNNDFPVGIAFNPSGDLLAAAGEGGNEIDLFSFDQSTGALTPTPQSPLAAGNNPYDVAFNPSGRLLATGNLEDGTITEYVAATDPTMTNVQCGPPASAGTAQTCSVSVTDSASSATPTGTVQFSSDGPGSFGTSSCTLDNGSCSVTYTPAPGSQGTQTITAAYQGDTGFAPSSQTTSLEILGTTKSRTTVGCDHPNAAQRQRVASGRSINLKCEALVRHPAARPGAKPSGTVDFSVNPSTASVSPASCTLPAASGTPNECSFKLTTSTAAGYTVTANYSGDTTYARSSASTTVNIP